jgi:hypothetical protein
MNVVKEEKKEWAKRGKLYTVGRAEIVETKNNSSVATTTTDAFLFLCLHNSHTFY